MILLKIDQDLKNMIFSQALATEMRSREGKKAEVPLPTQGPSTSGATGQPGPLR